MRYYALLYFDTEINLGIGIHPNVWVNHKTVDYTDGLKAFSDYINELHNSPSQVYLVSGESLEELDKAKENAVEKFNDPAWKGTLFKNK